MLGLACAAGAEPGDRFDTVVIDAGHGGEDQGARGPGGALEKDVVLAVAQRVAGRLREQGLRVVLTRDRDVFVPLEERTAIANDARADLFLSIHANAARDPEVSGSETYFLALDASDAGAAAVAKRENEAFQRAAAGIEAIEDPFISLLGDLIATEHLEESNAVARLVQEEMGHVDGLRSRGVKQALFVVLTGVQMPAALVEIGFVTHRDDEHTLAGRAGQTRIVGALEKAVLAYGRRYAARRGGSRPAKAAQPKEGQ